MIPPSQTRVYVVTIRDVNHSPSMEVASICFSNSIMFRHRLFVVKSVHTELVAVTRWLPGRPGYVIYFALGALIT
jgi:hypothetical protein